MPNIHSKEYQKFLKRLIKARTEACFTQVQAAKHLKKPQSYVSKCESGERRVDFTDLQKFAKLYKKSLLFFEG